MDLPIKKILVSETRNIIMNELNIRKAPGYDLITGKVLQESTPKCFKLLTYIFNAVLKLGYFPRIWKVAQIIMIPKPGKKLEEVTSYRPISLLPTISKIFEKIYVKKLKSITEMMHLIPDYQFGFRNKHGTIEQVHRIVNKINDDFQQKRYCSAAFIDMSQAFDKVWHTGLFYKIKKLLSYPHFLLLKSYLTNRHFLVRQNKEYSSLNAIKSGVPQGSVLGPILYLLYTSDLPTTPMVTIATCADDTAALSSHEDPKMASKQLQICLNKIQKWLSKWRMKANDLKSTHVTFTLRKETCPPVQLNNNNLPQAEDVKYLGIHLDRRLTWRKHIFTKRKQLGLKLSRLYWIIGRNSKLSLENKLLVYKAIIKPIWTYGIQLWGTASNSNINIIQRFQNKTIRLILDAPYYVPNSVIQRDLSIPTVQEVISEYSATYRERVSVHPNELAKRLFEDTHEEKRVKKFKPEDLIDRFK